MQGKLPHAVSGWLRNARNMCGLVSCASASAVSLPSLPPPPPTLGFDTPPLVTLWSLLVLTDVPFFVVREETPAHVQDREAGRGRGPITRVTCDSERSGLQGPTEGLQEA